jgi:hypothetical protein
MPDFLVLMHEDATRAIGDWAPYLAKLRASGRLQGGSAIGGGICVRAQGPVPHVSRHLGGYIRIAADSLDHAQSLLTDNPVFAAGGTLEIRELPETG